MATTVRRFTPTHPTISEESADGGRNAEPSSTGTGPSARRQLTGGHSVSGKNPIAAAFLSGLAPLSSGGSGQRGPNSASYQAAPPQGRGTFRQLRDPLTEGQKAFRDAALRDQTISRSFEAHRALATKGGSLLSSRSASKTPSPLPESMVVACPDNPAITFALVKMPDNSCVVRTRINDREDSSTDAHSHPTNYVQKGPGLEAMLGYMDANGVIYATAMPIPTSLQSRRGDDGRLEARVSLGHSDFDGVRPEGLAVGHSHDHAAGQRLDNCGSPHAYYLPADLLNELTGGELRDITIEDFRTEQGKVILQKIVDSGDLYVDTAVNSHLAQQYKELTREQQYRFDPMITGLNLNAHDIADKLLRELHRNPGVFTGVGEVTLSKEFVDQMYALRNQANVKDPAQIDNFKKLLAVMGKIGMPMTLHCDHDSFMDQVNDDPAHLRAEPANFASLKALFKDPMTKDTTIVWAHGGGLGRFVEPHGGHELHTQRLDALLRECPNVNIDLSWSKVAKQINQDPRTLALWVDLVAKHPTRFLMGEDNLAPTSAQTAGEVKQAYANLCAALDEKDPTGELRYGFMVRNYERTFVAARAKVRASEKLMKDDGLLDSIDRSVTPNGEPKPFVTLDEVANALKPARAPEILLPVDRNKDLPSIPSQ